MFERFPARVAPRLALCALAALAMLVLAAPALATGTRDEVGNESNPARAQVDFRIIIRDGIRVQGGDWAAATQGRAGPHARPHLREEHTEDGVRLTLAKP